jgi:hypothetical protein
MTLVHSSKQIYYFNKKIPQQAYYNSVLYDRKAYGIIITKEKIISHTFAKPHKIN